MGMGMGFMMPALWLELLRKNDPQAGPESLKCPECHHPCPTEARFCPACGHQFVVLQQCPHCFKNLSARARFCSQCGQSVDKSPLPLTCPHCRTENLAGAVYCNQCGEKLS